VNNNFEPYNRLTTSHLHYCRRLFL